MEREPGNEITFAREKACQIRKMISITCSYVVVSNEDNKVQFETFSSEHCSRKRFNRMSRINAGWKPEEEFQTSDACRLCGINFKISVGDFGGKNKYISTENLF